MTAALEIEAAGFIADRLRLGCTSPSELRLATLTRYGSADPFELPLVAFIALIGERDLHTAELKARDDLIKMLQADLRRHDDEKVPAAW